MIREANLHWRYVDGDVIMPWYTLPALQWLATLSIADWRVFEYGGGYSTIWWKLKAHEVESVDHDPAWAKPFGCEFLPVLEYINRPFGLYDCVIVDGEERLACIAKGRYHVKDKGYLIIDNWEFFQALEQKEILEHLIPGWELQYCRQPNHTVWTTLIARKP